MKMKIMSMQYLAVPVILLPASPLSAAEPALKISLCALWLIFCSSILRERRLRVCRDR